MLASDPAHRVNQNLCRAGIPPVIRLRAKVLFCNGPAGVNPSCAILLPGSRFCPGSARGCHLIGSERIGLAILGARGCMS